MSSNERNAGVVLGILSDAVAAIDAGRAPDGIVCAGLATSDVATIEVHRIRGGEWSVLLCRVRPAGAARTHDGVRVVVFTRDVPFTPEDVELWESARRPLSVLWRHVEEERARPVLVSTPVLRSESPEEHAMSRRERQVLALLAQGMLAQAIAHRLSGSRWTGRCAAPAPLHPDVSGGELIGGYSIVVGAAGKVG